MSETVVPSDERNRLVHQFIRVFGHRPSEIELHRYDVARRRIHVGLPARGRRRAAMLITRL